MKITNILNKAFLLLCPLLLMFMPLFLQGLGYDNESIKLILIGSYLFGLGLGLVF